MKQRLLNGTPENDIYLMNITHLFTVKASVDAHNNVLIYILSKTAKAQIKAVDMIIRDISDVKTQI